MQISRPIVIAVAEALLLLAAAPQAGAAEPLPSAASAGADKDEAAPAPFNLEDAGAIPSKWPAGSIETPEQAREVLKDTSVLRESIREAVLARHLACKDGTIFMDYCRGRAKALGEAREKELSAVEAEANAVIDSLSPAVTPEPEKRQPTLSERIGERIDAMNQPLPAALKDDSITKKWPKGSITTHEKAQAALDDTDKAREALDAAARVGHDVCVGRILVSGCWEDVRRQQYVRGKEIRAVELEAKDFIRAENAAKEKRRQLAARIEAGELVTEAQIEAAGLTPEEVADARAKAENRKLGEAQAQTDASQRTEDLASRLEKAEETKAVAAERVEDNKALQAKVAEKNAEAKRRAAEDRAHEAEAAKRERDLAERRAQAKQKAADAEKRRAERRANAEEQREKRLEAQKRYDEEKAKREKSFNPFQ